MARGGVIGGVCRMFVCFSAEMTDCYYICATQHSSWAKNRLCLVACILKGRGKGRGDEG